MAAGASLLQVFITANTTGLTAGLTKASASVKGFQSAVTGVGTTTQSTLGKVVPIAAGAAAVGIAAFAAKSIDAAVEYDRSMTKIAALTNATDEQITVMRDTIMSLAEETGTAPVELAHSMYFLASAGLDATQQLQVLEATAKGAAIGLGTAGDLARISANALNVFADNGLRAVDVLDTIAAAVREGTAEPDEFAAAIGRVLPIADKAGISFQQVAASLATMSNAGLNVNIGVTALRGLLQALVAPTVQSQKAMDALGLTVDDVVDSMASQGLIATLRMIDNQARRNTDSQGEYNVAMRNLIPNIRSLTGAFNLTQQEAAKVDKIFQDVAQSTGSLDRAFTETEQSASFKIRKAFADIAREGQNLATAVLPAIAGALQVVAGVFSVIGPPVAQVLGAFLTLKVLVGVFALLSTAAEAFAAVLFINLIPAIKALQSSSPLLLALTLLGVAMVALGGGAKVAAIALGTLAIAVGVFSDSLNAAQAKMGAFALAAIAVSEAIKAVQALRNQQHEAAAGFSDSMLKGKRSLDEYRAATEAAIGPQADLMKPWELIPGVLNGTVPAWDGFNEAAEQATARISEQNQVILEGTPLYNLYGSALDSTANMNLRMHGTLTQLIRDYFTQNGSLSGLSMSSVNAAVAQGKLGDAIDIVRDALERSNDALTTAIDKGGESPLAKAFLAAEPIIHATGMSMEEFQAQATEALNSRKWDEFAATITTDFTDAWNTFHDAAFNALNFLPGALDDLSSAAASAQDELDGMDSSSTTSASALADLQDQANLTGEEILTALREANKEGQSFGRDLLEISKIGGQAGKDLAASLMESGNVLAAQVIADESGKLQRQIVGMSGRGVAAADTLSTKLTNAIVGPLDTIAKILNHIARVWGVDIDLNSTAAEAKLAEFGRKLNAVDKDRVIDIFVNRHESRIERHDGGPIFHAGGLARMHDGGKKLAADEVPVVLQRGEFVVNRTAVQHVGLSFLEQVNRMHDGGAVTDPTLGIEPALAIPPIEIPPPDTKGETGGLLPKLRDIEKELKRVIEVLRGIRNAVRGGTGSGGTGGGSSSTSTSGGAGSSGTGGGGDSDKKPAAATIGDAVHRIIKITEQSGATIRDGVAIVKRVSEAGRDTGFITKAVATVREELGKDAAHLYARALKRLDEATLANDAKRAAAIKAALKEFPIKGQIAVTPEPRNFKWNKDMHKGAPRVTMHEGGLAADEVPTVLQTGEFVIRRGAARRLGPKVLRDLNKMHGGGGVAEGGAGFGGVAEYGRRPVPSHNGHMHMSWTAPVDRARPSQGINFWNGKIGRQLVLARSGGLDVAADLSKAKAKRLMGWTSWNLNHIHVNPNIRDIKWPLWPLLLQHEMGHALGLGHVRGNNIMNPKLTSNLVTKAQTDNIRHDWRNVDKKHGGGAVRGLKADEVEAVLQTGEFVVRRSAVKKLGIPFLERLNKMHDGGAVTEVPEAEVPSIEIPTTKTDPSQLLAVLRRMEREQFRQLAIERDIRGILKGIRGDLKAAPHGGGTGGSGSSSTGGSGGTGGDGSGDRSKTAFEFADAVHRIVKLTRKSGGTLAEGVDVVRRVSQEGSDAAFISKAVTSVREEMGKDAAKLYARALKRLDSATLHSDAQRAAAIQAALRAESALHAADRAREEARADPDWVPKWYDLANKNVPRMPPNHTDISVNPHNRDTRRINVRLDRRHMDEEMAYDSSYRGF